MWSQIHKNTYSTSELTTRNNLWSYSTSECRKAGVMDKETQEWQLWKWPNGLIKKKIKFSWYLRKFSWSSCKVINEEGLPNTVYEENAQIFNHIWGGRQSYMTLQLLRSEFPYLWGTIDFLFYQCGSTCWGRPCSPSLTCWCPPAPECSPACPSPRHKFQLEFKRNSKTIFTVQFC